MSYTVLSQSSAESHQCKPCWWFSPDWWVNMHRYNHLLIRNYIYTSPASSDNQVSPDLHVLTHAFGLGVVVHLIEFCTTKQVICDTDIGSVPGFLSILLSRYGEQHDGHRRFLNSLVVQTYNLYSKWPLWIKQRSSNFLWQLSHCDTLVWTFHVKSWDKSSIKTFLLILKVL